MSDDLVKMARLAQRDERMSTGALYGDLADRIEELEAQRAKTYQALLRVTKIHDEVEAKLAKAVEALERIASGEFSGRMLTSMPPQDAAAYFARTTIAELKGEVRDE